MFACRKCFSTLFAKYLKLIADFIGLPVLPSLHFLIAVMMGRMASYGVGHLAASWMVNVALRTLLHCHTNPVLNEKNILKEH